MHSIQKTDFGLRLVFSGTLSPDELKKWMKESEAMLKNMKKNFGVFIDMVELMVLDSNTVDALIEGQKLYHANGMGRSVVVFKSDVLQMQMTRIAKKSGIFHSERYIDVTKDTDWQKTALDWIISGIEPE